MQLFVGIILGILFSFPFCFLLLKKYRCCKNRERTESAQSDELERVSKLAGMLAHELKNPLSTIKINLKLINETLERNLRDEAQSEKSKDIKRAKKKVDFIQNEADRLEQIFDGYLKYLNKSDFNFTENDINEVVSDVIDFYMPQCHKKSVALRQKLCSKPLYSKIDSDMFKQVLLNLFINSLDAMENGGELMVKTDKKGDEAAICVSDTGSGIPEEKLNRIFDLYYSSKTNGFGLGLPTAKKIIEGHGGNISVESEMNKGTSFTITIPLIGRQ